MELRGPEQINNERLQAWARNYNPDQAGQDAGRQQGVGRGAGQNPGLGQGQGGGNFNPPGGYG